MNKVEKVKKMAVNLFNYANDISDGVLAEVVARGGVVALVVKEQTLGISLILQNDSVPDELRSAVREGHIVVFYLCPNAPLPDDVEGFEVKTIVAPPDEKRLEEVWAEVNKHLEKTGGVKLD